MALNNLTYFELDGGTSENPLVLTAQQLDGLINLTKKANCTSDVRGYVTTETGHIAAYQKHLLENAYPNLNIAVSQENVDPDIWDIRFTANESNVIELPEGDEVKFTVTGIDLSLLRVDLTHSPSGIMLEAVQSRISVEGDVIRCTPPNDNYNWSDSVTVTVYPEYNSSDIHTLTVNVRATSIQNMSLTGDSSEVGTNAYLNITANLLPANHTKSNCVVVTAESSNEGGGQEYPISVTGTTISYRVPYVTQECEATVTAYARISGSSTIIATDTAHLSIVLPTLRAYVTANGSPDSTHEITITDTVTGTITELGNTESMSTVEGRAYILGAAPEYSGYTSEFTITGATLTNNQFVATSGVISISLVYTAKQPDIYVVYSETDSNGKNYYENIDDVISRGAAATDKNIEAFCVSSEICVTTYNINNSYRACLIGRNGVATFSTGTPSLSDTDGIVHPPLGTPATTEIYYYNWNNRESYIGNCGEIIQFFNNISKINEVLYNILYTNRIGTSSSVWLPFSTGGWNSYYTFNYSDKLIVEKPYTYTSSLLVFYSWNPLRDGVLLPQ